MEANAEKILLSKDKPWKRLDIVIATICLNLMSLLLPIFILQLYDRVIPKEGTSTLIFLSIGMGVAIILEIILRFSRSQILTWSGANFQNNVSSKAFSKITNAPPNQTKKESGVHLENMESPTVLREFLAGSGFLALLDLPFLFLYIGIIAFFAKSLVIAPIVVISIFIISLLTIINKLRKNIDLRNDVDERKYNLLIEILKNYHTLKALALEESMMRRFERLHTQSSLIEYKINLYSNEARDIGTVFSYILFGSVATLGAFYVINHQITPGIMGACVILSNRLMQPVQSALGVCTRFHDYKLAKKRFNEIEKLSSIKIANENNINGDIKLNNISKSFGEKVILDDISMHIKPNTITSIYGGNGEGKTTLLQIISGNISPDNGQVLINDEEIEPTYKYKGISYLGAENVLLEGTILENMTLFHPYLHKDAAIHYCSRIGLNTWINRMPSGLDTHVGSDLIQSLPSGILQRICLIQALIMNPKILILDEANTSLDFKSDIAFKSILIEQKKKSTIIVATHRPSMRGISDNSFTISNGKILQDSEKILLNKSYGKSI